METVHPPLARSAVEAITLSQKVWPDWLVMVIACGSYSMYSAFPEPFG